MHKKLYGIIRKNSRTGIGEIVTIKKAEIMLGNGAAVIGSLFAVYYVVRMAANDEAARHPASRYSSYRSDH